MHFQVYAAEHARYASSDENSGARVRWRRSHAIADHVVAAFTTRCAAPEHPRDTAPSATNVVIGTPRCIVVDVSDTRGLPRESRPRRPMRPAGCLVLAAAFVACLTVRSPAPAAKPQVGSGAIASPSDPSAARGKADSLPPLPGEPSAAQANGQAQAPKELPRGGRFLFPAHRLVGFCGTPGAPALGELQGNLPAKAKELEAQAAHYAQGRTLLPVFELIAVVVQSGAGPDGKYRRRVDDAVVDEYLRQARRSKGLLLLNIQPGHSDFLTEVRAFEKYLREPDVGVALDPEWAMKANQRPGVFYGQTNGETINDVADYLSSLIQEENLPEKALVFHQVNRDVLKDESAMTNHPGVAIIKSVDGLGYVHAKIVTYGSLMETMAKGVHPGFKLFFDEDRRNGSRLMTPKEVLGLSPQPEYVLYE